MKERARILFANHAIYSSGAENSLLHLIDGIREADFEPYAICPGNSPLIDQLRLRSISPGVAAFGKGPGPFLETVRAIQQEIRRHTIDLVHANSIDATQFCALPTRISGVPLIGHVRNISPFRPHGLWLIKQARRLIAVSGATRDSLISQGVEPERVTVIYNGVDIQRFRPRPEFRLAARKKFDLPYPGVVIGAAGRLDPIKGYTFLLEAAAQVCRLHPSAVFVIAGSDPTPSQDHKRYLDKAVKIHGLEERIIFLGDINNVDELLPCLDIFVLPSLQEPFARVILEAMSSGCAVVATKVGGTPEAIDDRKTGFLVPPADPHRLAIAIDALISNQDLASELGQSARDRVIQDFSITKNTEQTINIYKRLIGKNHHV